MLGEVTSQMWGFRRISCCLQNLLHCDPLFPPHVSLDDWGKELKRSKSTTSKWILGHQIYNIAWRHHWSFFHPTWKLWACLDVFRVNRRLSIHSSPARTYRWLRPHMGWNLARKLQVIVYYWKRIRTWNKFNLNLNRILIYELFISF